MEHWFWISICILTVIWYISVTLVVGLKGMKEIARMVKGKKDPV